MMMLVPTLFAAIGIGVLIGWVRVRAPFVRSLELRAQSRDDYREFAPLLRMDRMGIAFAGGMLIGVWVSAAVGFALE